MRALVGLSFPNENDLVGGGSMWINALVICEIPPYRACFEQNRADTQNLFLLIYLFAHSDFWTSERRSRVERLIADALDTYSTRCIYNTAVWHVSCHVRLSWSRFRFLPRFFKRSLSFFQSIYEVFSNMIRFRHICFFVQSSTSMRNNLFFHHIRKLPLNKTHSGNYR